MDFVTKSAKLGVRLDPSDEVSGHQHVPLLLICPSNVDGAYRSLLVVVDIEWSFALTGSG